MHSQEPIENTGIFIKTGGPTSWNNGGDRLKPGGPMVRWTGTIRNGGQIIGMTHGDDHVGLLSLPPCALSGLWAAFIFLTGLPGCGRTATGALQAQFDAAGVDVAGVQDSAVVDAYVFPCTEQIFQCREDGTARVYVDGVPTDLGLCPLGCHQGLCECRVPSNVPANLADDGNGDLNVSPAQSPVQIDTDTGAITTQGHETIRPPDVFGLHPPTGISYARINQDWHPELAVFTLRNLTIMEDAEVRVVGERAFVLLASEQVSIFGIIDVSARASLGGAGGYRGGRPGELGRGPCTGHIGKATDYGARGCTSGGGGGGHGGRGGNGGDALCPFRRWGGDGGGDHCGTRELVPLVGGSGGAGGLGIVDLIDVTPASGGGGGGAIQISAGGGITVGDEGGINAGGGGGGECENAGGAGGGAGGAILLESQRVSVVGGGVLAANGGGGGAGD